MNKIRIEALALAGALTFPITDAVAEPTVKFETQYVITVRGFTVAKADFRGKVQGSTFEVDGKLRSAGLARIFDKTDARSRSVGVLGNGTPQPNGFLLSYNQGSSGDKKMEIAFSGGNVANVTHQPALGPAGNDLVPLSDGDLKAVTDPVSATIVVRGTPEDICNRTLRVYEGGTRVDVQLSPVSVGWIYGVGNGAVTCSGKFIPVAGYIKGATYDYMRQHANMEFIYAPTRRQGIYMLHSITTQTDIGQVKLRAWRQKVSG
ncbi:DUF3108 domain-containing protein [Mesorhizobium sp. Z1-4]|uniref:DUF3108 domain-containing protein n=1 Tax=Mesorhizobium sp. Z1-4 TaxID=2448478 RepID=UPI0013DEA430|nr:DUF3108 domain-containing protein [Mesorhizobium sp. Z1-4]